MLAIEKAWNDNLKLSKEDQWESKQDIMENYCPNSMEIGLDLKEPKHCPEEYDEEICIRCWNRKVGEDKIEDQNDNLELTFKQLKESPVDKITLNLNIDDENYFSEMVKDNDDIIFADDSLIKYDDIPELVAWLQSVYNYCTELKNKVEYVDFNIAKEWMYDNGVAECEGVLYDSSSIFTLDVIDSAKWILIKS